MTELKQRFLFTRKEFYLTPMGVKVISNTLSENLEYTVKYDELGFDIVKKRVKTALLPAIIFTFFFFLQLYLLLDGIYNQDKPSLIIMWTACSVFFGLLAITSFYMSNKNEVYLTGGTKQLELLMNKPSEEAVIDFIEAVHEHIRIFYKEKFGVIDKHLPEEVLMERFLWLKDNGMIDEEEYDYLVFQLQIDDLLS